MGFVFKCFSYSYSSFALWGDLWRNHHKISLGQCTPVTNSDIKTGYNFNEDVILLILYTSFNLQLVYWIVTLSLGWLRKWLGIYCKWSHGWYETCRQGRMGMAGDSGLCRTYADTDRTRDSPTWVKSNFILKGLFWATSGILYVPCIL